MIDTRTLKQIIKAAGQTQKTTAAAIGMTQSAFYSRMKRGIFGSDDIMKMADFLKMENPAAVFYAR